ncbi:MAG: hypothetical protein JSS86_17210, partial [Cyanobacteria bacterium SZAS LIN-2]|nr:hypothetical protein [Cyanobacteria bacterium SZAS LIN-2]
VFNGAGNNNAIQLFGGVQIQADPPAASAPAAGLLNASANLTSTATSVASGNVASTATAAGTTVSAPAEISNVNWSLPAITALNASLQDGVTANVAGLSDSTVLSGRGGLRVARASNGMSAHRVLTGGVATDGVQTMDEGVTLISPKTDTTIKTGFGSVDVAAGAVAMIMSYDGGMAVYNLHDTKSGAVVVKVGANKVRVSPGQNIVLTSRSVRSFEDINPGQAIAYRRVVAKDWGNGVQAFHSEFSILSMLQNYGAVRELVKSQDAETRKTVDAMLKTSAILLQIGGEKYEYMKAPAVTAMR